MNELKPCPFCGGEAERYETDAGCVKVNCRKCHIETPWGKHRFETDDIDKWNRRAPEPGTSVIRWTRYDGTPETLPDINRDILVYWANKLQIRTVYTEICELFDVDDVWAYLPDPPEVME